jgi:hypothetical protein
MQIAVLNGTSTAGLAHRLSSSLQQNGYSQAAPLQGTPPGVHQVTVVEYASGHRADAEQVAHALSVTQVRSLESSVSQLVGGSTVVVIVGQDQAGGANASGTGESSAGTGEPASGAGAGTAP